MMVYIVCMVTEEEYAGFEIVFVTDDEEKAKAYCNEHQEKWRHWTGSVFDRYYYLEEEIV